MPSIRAIALLAFIFILPACTTFPRARALAPLAAQLTALDSAARDYAQAPLLNARLLPPQREPTLITESAARTTQASAIITLRAALSHYLTSLALLAGEPAAPFNPEGQPHQQLAAALAAAGLITPQTTTAASRLAAAAQRAASATYRAHALTQIARDTHPHLLTLASGLESLITSNFDQSLDIEAAVIAAWSAANTSADPALTSLTRERTGALTAELTLRRARAARAVAILREVIAAHAEIAGVPTATP